MIKIIPLSAFNDNYIWILINNATNDCVAVDPGDAKPVLDYIKKNNVNLKDILITHHHHDHTGGINELHDKIENLTVYGPAKENIPHIDHGLSEDTPIHLDSIDVDFQILDIPGHTKGHIAYVGNGAVFSGDTLFAAGCGRVFEGTHEQMFHSLQKISRLPLDTAIYCGHEYTQANLKFAAAVEPSNEDIKKRIAEVDKLRQDTQPTLPSTLALEKKTNPFLRCDSVVAFKTIRDWKDSF